MSCTICSLLGPWQGRDEGQAACTAPGSCREQQGSGHAGEQQPTQFGSSLDSTFTPIRTGPRGTP